MMSVSKRAALGGFAVCTLLVPGMICLYQPWLSEVQVWLPVFILFASLRAESRPHALAYGILQVVGIVVPVVLAMHTLPHLLGPLWIRIGLVALVGTMSAIVRARREPPPPNGGMEATLGFCPLFMACAPAWMLSVFIETMRHS